MLLFSEAGNHFCLNSVEEYAQELQQTAKDNENVKYGVHPPLLFADAVENGADGVADAAEQQQQEAGLGQHLTGLGEEGENGPAHKNIADHRKNFVFLQVNGCKGHCQGRKAPLKGK